jgi:hypothetical protein
MREVRINCRLTPEENRQLEKHARVAGIRPTTFLRKSAFAYLEQSVLLPPGTEESLSRLLQETRRIGTNLNQLAAKANSLQRMFMGDVRKAHRIVDDFEERLHELENLLRSLRPKP